MINTQTEILVTKFSQDMYIDNLRVSIFRPSTSDLLMMLGAFKKKILKYS